MPMKETVECCELMRNDRLNDIYVGSNSRNAYLQQGMKKFAQSVKKDKIPYSKGEVVCKWWSPVSLYMASLIKAEVNFHNLSYWNAFNEY